jgi:hypothetical protein
MSMKKAPLALADRGSRYCGILTDVGGGLEESGSWASFRIGRIIIPLQPDSVPFPPDFLTAPIYHDQSAG